MSEKKVLLRFHLENERERKAWELLLHRKQQDGCSYGDVVMDALLADESRTVEISAVQEERIVSRVREALASCTIQAATVATDDSAPVCTTSVPVPLTSTEADTPDEIDSYAFVDWEFAGSGDGSMLAN